MHICGGTPAIDDTSRGARMEIGGCCWTWLTILAEERGEASPREWRVHTYRRHRLYAQLIRDCARTPSCFVREEKGEERSMIGTAAAAAAAAAADFSAACRYRISIRLRFRERSCWLMGLSCLLFRIRAEVGEVTLPRGVSALMIESLLTSAAVFTRRCKLGTTRKLKKV